MPGERDLGPGIRAEVLEVFAEAASRAGAIVLAHRARGCVVETKADLSPVTAADRESEAEILTRVRRVLGDIPVIAEESANRGLAGFDPERPFLVIDPIDGTKEFIEGRSEFTVNLALIRNRTPVIGVIYAPALEMLYVGGGGEAWTGWLDPGQPLRSLRGKRALHCRVPEPSRVVAVASRKHLDPETQGFLDALPGGECIFRGSSIKFCIIAEGQADLYPRFAPTSEWDTAAGEAILRAAGGSLTDLDGKPLVYGKTETGFLNPGFIARGRTV
ncbi:3'(2'),5'-bisphosphate nucleotidase CysQ [Hyphomicrobium sp.]|uniref:3'(2'),5'-bisphosphate nucleotidase CysQ n=1 Tax=Hyphomicrobium sp. TaxID=82 RepID=UPI0025B7AE7A|nr:3'(2'),5'-bisphosphate nucleotidase CysQ [Hyphomicrobium sp.]MCC7251394.1 3'(2'),5'-bisphosphate nucleotidase CysQ [Hyphomicrobium sp.]